jgi:hypothetical protein
LPWERILLRSTCTVRVGGDEGEEEGVWVMVRQEEESVRRVFRMAKWARLWACPHFCTELGFGE